MLLLCKAEYTYYLYYHDNNNVPLLILYFVWSGMWRMQLPVCVYSTVRLCSNPITSSRVPQVISVSLQLCSGLGCDELETYLLSLGFPVERFHWEVIRWSQWSIISSFPPVGVWISGMPFMTSKTGGSTPGSSTACSVAWGCSSQRQDFTFAFVVLFEAPTTPLLWWDPSEHQLCLPEFCSLFQ